MIGLLGKKVGMTQIFDETGRQIPVTVIEAGPCAVTSLRTKEKDGYSAVQLAFDKMREKRASKPRVGFFRKRSLGPMRFVREIRTEATGGLKVGLELGADQFQVGDYVDVRGVSIGRGFQGVVKRHNFRGCASKSHGQMTGRRPGSIGASSFPSRVVKGMRMAGHLGAANITVQSLKVVKVDSAKNLLVLRGSVPGAEGGYLVIHLSLRRGAKREWKLPAPPEAAAQAKPAEPQAEKSGDKKD